MRVEGAVPLGHSISVGGEVASAPPPEEPCSSATPSVHGDSKKPWQTRLGSHDSTLGSMGRRIAISSDKYEAPMLFVFFHRISSAFGLSLLAIQHS